MATLSGLTWSESQALTRTAPTTDSTEGLPIKDVDAITVVLEAPVGQTLSGAGTLRGYVWDDALGAWVWMPSMDLTVSKTGVRRLAFEPFEVVGPRTSSRAMWTTDAVTISSGSSVTVYLLGYGSNARGR